MKKVAGRGLRATTTDAFVSCLLATTMFAAVTGAGPSVGVVTAAGSTAPSLVRDRIKPGQYRPELFVGGVSYGSPLADVSVYVGSDTEGETFRDAVVKDSKGSIRGDAA